MADVIDWVSCPMLSKVIDIGYCIELQWIIDGDVKPTEDEAHLTEKDFAICRECKKRIDQSL